MQSPLLSVSTKNLMLKTKNNNNNINKINARRDSAPRGCEPFGKAILRPQFALSAALLFALASMAATTFLGHQHQQEQQNHQQQEEPWKVSASDSHRIPRSAAANEGYTNDKMVYPNDGISVGVLSEQPTSFFRALQRQIDESDDVIRCRRYGFTETLPTTTRRRIFFGALLAEETWELLEIVAAEAYGIFEGMVFVESNRTQSFAPRNIKRTNHTATLKKLFGTKKVQVRTYVNEVNWNRTMWREHDQREEILKGWKELGMQPDDIAYMGDTDETFTRDFLRAVQRCYVASLDYDATQCHYSRNRVFAASRMFFSSPECMSRDHAIFHPDMTLGHCVEGIGDASVHPIAPRVDRYKRAPGFGNGCRDRANETKASALWNAADFRVNPCGGTGKMLVNTKLHPELDMHTGFHFHNFFANAEALRFKYATYGHYHKDAYTRNLLHLGSVSMVWQCTQNLTDQELPSLNRRPEPGKFAGLKPFLPIYFQDADYRRRRHEMVSDMLKEHDDGKPFPYRGTPPMMMTGGQAQGQMMMAAKPQPRR